MASCYASLPSNQLKSGNSHFWNIKTKWKWNEVMIPSELMRSALHETLCNQPTTNFLLPLRQMGCSKVLNFLYFIAWVNKIVVDKNVYSVFYTGIKMQHCVLSRKYFSVDMCCFLNGTPVALRYISMASKLFERIHFPILLPLPMAVFITNFNTF